MFSGRIKQIPCPFITYTLHEWRHTWGPGWQKVLRSQGAEKVVCMQVDELDYAIRKKDPSKANVLLADVQKSLDTAISGIAA